MDAARKDLGRCRPSGGMAMESVHVVDQLDLKLDPENPICPFCGRPARCLLLSDLDDSSAEKPPSGEVEGVRRNRYRMDCLRGHSVEF